MNGAAPWRLAAGDWEVDFEPWSGWLRRLTWRGEEQVRAIYAAVRDESWGTVPGETEAVVREEDGAVVVEFQTRHVSRRFSFHGRIRLHPGEGLTFEVEGTAQERFQTMRTGLCLLHPAEQAGAALQVTHPDGGTERLGFPVEIAPHQPVLDIARLEVEGGPTIQFEGEVFEMEDQRNWSDASFKTYCRPLGLPSPYEVAPDAPIRHKITVTTGGTGAFRAPEFIGRVPRWLVRLAPGQSPDDLPEGSIPWRGLFYADFREPGWTAPAISRLDQAGTVIRDPEGLAPDGAWAARVTDGRTPGDWLIRDGNFTELNRNRPAQGEFAGLAYPVQPQVHAFQDLDILENALMIPVQAASARKIDPGAAVALLPIHFGGGLETVLGRAANGLAGRTWRRLMPWVASAAGADFALLWSLDELAWSVGEAAAVWRRAEGSPVRMIRSPENPWLVRFAMAGPDGPKTAVLNCSAWPAEAEGTILGPLEMIES
ncbi:MAG: hypothetical protein MH204_06895 [Fimbriimonadaceae bacterium]|nr:hypothetical protein [Fimbriimonadaceae bacterium]